jgi:hypothetical protein
MFSLKSIALAAVVVSIAQAAPASKVRQDIELLLLCNDPNQGDCLDFQTTPDVCCKSL